MKKPKRYYVADFETTVYAGQDFTEVWAAAITPLEVEDGKVFNNIVDFLDYCFMLPDSPVIYFHNLAFDGQFILAHLYSPGSGYKQAIKPVPVIRGQRGNDEDIFAYEWLQYKNWPNRAFSFVLSEKNQFYIIRVKRGGKLIEFRDSLKLLPMSVKVMGESFKTEHQKGSIEYKGFRRAYGDITQEERDYILNDVYVVRESLQYLYSQGMDRITIGACCMHDWKQRFKANYGDLRSFFPYLDKIAYSPGETVDHFCRSAYKGGWCYLKKGQAGKIQGRGYTLDVNSLYPSRMHSSSGCKYPYGLPHAWHGDYIPDEALQENRYYYIRIRCRFKIKPGYLPTVQIKNDPLYDGREWLETSDVWDSVNKRYTQYVTGLDGRTETHIVNLTMTCTDYDMFREHYDVMNLQIIGGVWFTAAAGFFDEYLDYWNNIKMNSKAGKRLIAKLMMNNLYGKTAASDDSSFKFIGGYKENGAVLFHTQEEHNKDTFYIAVGAAITSYCRAFTITAAQANYEHFIYADTDSLHMIGSVADAVGVNIDSKKFNCWKHESDWKRGIFVQQKRYIEEVYTGSGSQTEYDIKCAGMKRSCQKMLQHALEGVHLMPDLSGEEYNFISHPKTLQDFRPGLVVPGNLKAKLIKGGVILEDREYTMR